MIEERRLESRAVAFFDRQPRLSLVLFGLAVNGLIGFADYLVGYDIGLSVFYLVPIGFISWFVNRKAGIYMSIVASATIIISDLGAGKFIQNYFIEFWEIFLHLSFFSVVTVLIAALRNDLVKRDELIHKLQNALSEIRTLSGLLPICAWCKKIRDDQGYWKQVEHYISDHTDAEFTHGICPDCMKRVNAESDDEHLHTDKNG